MKNMKYNYAYILLYIFNCIFLFLKRTFDCKYAGNGSNYPHIFFVCGHILADNGYSIPYYRVRTALRQVLYNDASCGFAGGEQ